MNFSLLCPTRKRPKLMERLCRSVIETADHPDEIEIVFYIDRDDTESQLKVTELCSIANIAIIIDERISQGEMTNVCATIANGSILHMCGDDLIFRTKSWDTQIKEVFDEYDDNIVLVYTDDGIHGQSFGTHPFVHLTWFQVLGRVCYGYKHGYCDRYVSDIANMINRIRYIPLLIEHMHHSFGKGEFDQTSADLKEALDKYRPDLLYLQTHELRVRDAKKLQNYIDQYASISR